MERIVNIARSFEQARRWEIEQYQRMTPEERRECARVLQDRHFGKNCPDVREVERAR